MGHARPNRYFDDLEEIGDTPGEIPTGKVYDPQLGKSVFKRFGTPHVAMDQTFFPMAEGTRTELKLKMAPPKYTNVTYLLSDARRARRIERVRHGT